MIEIQRSKRWDQAEPDPPACVNGPRILWRGMDRRVGSNAELIHQGKNELFIRVVVNDPGRKRRELIAQRNTELADREPLNTMHCDSWENGERRYQAYRIAGEIGARDISMDCFSFSNHRMLSFFSMGTRVGLIFFLSAAVPVNFLRIQNLTAASNLKTPMPWSRRHRTNWCRNSNAGLGM